MDRNAIGNGVLVREHVLAQFKTGVLGKSSTLRPLIGLWIRLIRGEVLPRAIAGNDRVIPFSALGVAQNHGIAERVHQLQFPAGGRKATAGFGGEVDLRLPLSQVSPVLS